MSANKIKITFSKLENIKYISHLDFVRMWQRTFKRAGIDLKYSQGFNPHPVMSFLSPLSVGFTSECEVLFCELEEYLDTDELINKLSLALPEGIKINDISYIKENTPKEHITQSLYDVKVYCNNVADLNVDDFLNNEEIIIPKKTKKGIKDVDIKPLIIKVVKTGEGENHIKFSMLLMSGDTSTLNPKLLVEAMEKYVPDFKAEHIQVHRRHMQ